MKLLYIFIQRAALFLPATLLFSCIHNVIEFKSIDKPKKSELSHSKPLKLVVDDFSKTIGYQYMFVIFPFGKITALTTKEELSNFLELELLAKGYHVSKNSKYTLKVNIHNLRANVYDFIVIRKLSCDVNLNLEYYINDRLLITKDLSKKYSSYEKFAFKPKITNCVNEVVLNTLRESFNKKYFEIF